MREQGDNKDHQENEKEDLGNSRRRQIPRIPRSTRSPKKPERSKALLLLFCSSVIRANSMPVLWTMLRANAVPTNRPKTLEAGILKRRDFPRRVKATH